MQPLENLDRPENIGPVIRDPWDDPTQEDWPDNPTPPSLPQEVVPDGLGSD